jgi:hypothetical protein
MLTHDISLGSSPVTNVATASGADVLGGFVSDADEATVTAVAGEGGAGGVGGGNPFTGSTAGLLAGWMGGLVALGSLLIAVSRRRPTRG